MMNSKPAWVALFLFLLVFGTRVPSLAQLLGQWHFNSLVENRAVNNGQRSLR